MNAHDATLRPLDAFPSSSYPKGRRAELERLLQDRRAATARAASCAALVGLCLFFAFFYGAFSAYFWTTSMGALVGTLFSVFSGITLAGAGVLAFRFAEESRAIPPVDPQLKREAEAESAIELAMLDINLKSYDWNDLARAARNHDVSEPILRGLRAQRAKLQRTRDEVAEALRRFNLATGPKPQAVPPPRDWGTVETIDLRSTDS